MFIIYSGGQGRQQLNLVPTESEGHCCSTTMPYIMPLQDKIDPLPLSPDALEFSVMAKAESKKCIIMMPQQSLALHLRECNIHERLSDSEPEVQ